jgi:hypothetical protein
MHKGYETLDPKLRKPKKLALEAHHIWAIAKAEKNNNNNELHKFEVNKKGVKQKDTQINELEELGTWNKSGSREGGGRSSGGEGGKTVDPSFRERQKEMAEAR